MNKVLEPVEETHKIFCKRKTHCVETRAAWCATTCGITYSHEVYYETTKENGLQEAPTYRQEQPDRKLRCWLSSGGLWF